MRELRDVGVNLPWPNGQKSKTSGPESGGGLISRTFWEVWCKSVNFGPGTDLGGAALDLEGQIVFFAYLDLYHKPPDSNQRHNKSRS